MLNIKNEIAYIIILELLKKLFKRGLLTAEEFAVAKDLATQEYRPASVWEQLWIFAKRCSNVAVKIGKEVILYGKSEDYPAYNHAK